MPDTIAAFSQGRRTFLATANEGDARPDDVDLVRVKDATLDASLKPLTENKRLGRLEISKLDGDTDGDGKIEVPTMFGTRSFSLWDATTDKLVFDSGSLEPLLESHSPSSTIPRKRSPTKWIPAPTSAAPNPKPSPWAGSMASTTFSWAWSGRMAC
jgi:hypothetical protein